METDPDTNLAEYLRALQDKSWLAWASLAVAVVSVAFAAFQVGLFFAGDEKSDLRNRIDELRSENSRLTDQLEKAEASLEQTEKSYAASREELERHLEESDSLRGTGSTGSNGDDQISSDSTDEMGAAQELQPGDPEGEDSDQDSGRPEDSQTSGVVLGYDLEAVSSNGYDFGTRCQGFYTDTVMLGDVRHRQALHCELAQEVSLGGWQEFNLDRNYARFEAVIGQVNTSAETTDVIEFSVHGDGQELFREALEFGDATPVDVDVTGVLRLRLEVEQLSTGTNKGRFTQVAWGSPALR